MARYAMTNSITSRKKIQCIPDRINWVACCDMMIVLSKQITYTKCSFKTIQENFA